MGYDRTSIAWTNQNNDMVSRMSQSIIDLVIMSINFDRSWASKILIFLRSLNLIFGFISMKTDFVIKYVTQERLDTRSNGCDYNYSWLSQF